MANNPITSKDLYQDDGHLDKLLKQLQAVNEGIESIERRAESLNKELQGLNITKPGDQQRITAIAKETDELARAHIGLKKAQSEQAAEVAKVREETKKLNTEQRNQAKLAKALTGSYNQLSASLSINLARWHALSPAQRKNTQEGQALLKTIQQQRAELKALDVQTGTHTRNVGNYTGAIGGLTRSLFQLVGAYVSLTGLSNLISNIFGQTKELDSLDQANQRVLGSTEKVAKAQAFLNDISERYGANLLVLNRSYLKFVASAQAAGQTQEQTNEIFESFTKVTSVLGLRVDEQEGIFRALEQIMSKGTVQAEELRGQLGDRLPGAFVIAADAMGVTTRELNKMLKAGEVISSEFLPKFAKQVEIAFGAQNVDRVDNLAAAQGRFRREFTLLVDDLGASDVFKDFFTSITAFLRGIRDNLGTITALGKAFAYATAAIIAYRVTGLIGAIKYTDLLTRAQKALNLAMKSNPVGLLISAAVIAIGVLQTLKERTDGVTAAQQGLSRAQSAASADVESTRIRIELLTKAYGDEETTLKERQGILNELQRIMPGYLENLKAEKTSVEDITEASEKYLEVLQKTLTARALEGDLTEAIREQKELERRLSEGDFIKGRGAAGGALSDLLFGTTQTSKGIENRLKEVNALIETLKGQIGEIGPITDIAGGGTETTDTGRGKEDKDLLSVFEKRRELARLIQNDRERELELLQIDLDEQLKKWKKNGLDTEALIKLFAKRRQEIEADDQNRTIDIQDNAFLKRLQVAKEFVANFLGVQGNIAKQNAKEAEEEYERRQKNIEAETDHQIKLFNLSKATDNEKLRYSIAKEIEKQELLFQLAKTFNKDLSKEEVAQFERTIAELRAKLNIASQDTGQVDNIFDLLGIKFSNDPGEQQLIEQALSQAYDFAKSQLQSYFDLQKQLTDQAVEDADRRVSAAESALDRELALMRDGYANRVTTAQKELTLAKKQQAEALKERQKFNVAQLKLNTALEASNLVVAVARTLAEVPPPYNIIAASIMLASFAIAKAKAFQLAKKQQFGEGGLEIIGGGSHESGKDTPLGFKTKSGKQAYAEKGEAHMILKKRATAKYKKELPSIFNALNRGIFHDMYVKRQERMVAGIPFVSNTISTQKMEDKLDGILVHMKNQEKLSSYKDPEGFIIEKRERGSTIRITKRWVN